jgi:hypothetical protein
MIRVIYASRPTQLSPTDIEDIEAISARNNAARGLTGILIHDAAFFLQIIEGPDEAVDALLRTLEKDPRHTDMAVVFRTRIDASSFPGWDMRLIENDAIQNPVLSPYATDNRIAPDSLLATQLNALARDIADYF